VYAYIADSDAGNAGGIRTTGICRDDGTRKWIRAENFNAFSRTAPKWPNSSSSPTREPLAEQGNGGGDIRPNC
jgi:hypothetical protein